MSDKDWTDIILANSGLPADDFTFTDGSNYGLDGFDFDSEEDAGVLDGARLPETKGLAQLPDGFTGAYQRTAEDEITLVDEVGGVHLSSFIDENAVEKTASLADLDWLDPTQPQDPDRLPTNPPWQSLEELAEAWGVNRRTDGIALVPNKDKEIADYQESLKETDVSGLPGNKEAREQVKVAIRWALRRADAGASPTEIKKGLVARLGHQARLTRKVVAQIEADHGLAGNVFLTAAAYPDIHRGARAEDIKAHLRKLKARYVVVPEGDQRLAVWESIGKKPVTKVPWKAALRHYGPELEATGHKVASEGNAREILRRAFLSGPVEKEHVPSVKPRDVRPSERVTVQEAVQQFRTAEAVPRQAISSTSRIEEAARKKALVQIARWVKAGHLSLTDAHRLARSTVAPQMILRTATMLVKAATAASTGAYKGEGTHYKVKAASMSRDAAWAQLHAAEAEMDRKARELEDARRQKLASTLVPMVRKGLLTKDEAAKLAALDKPVDEILKLAAAASQYKRPPKMKAADEREYEGPLLRVAQVQRKDASEFNPEEKRLLEASQKSGIKVSEFQSLLKWARIQMSEGAAGKELDQMIKLRFAPPLVKAAKSLIKAVRKEHEGLSGHAYVDAGAYVTAKGTKGCEQGAMTHRTGSLKVVLAVEKCSTCVLKNAAGVCTVYNKPLVSEPPVVDREVYQRVAIKNANSSDAEVTASLFAPTYNESEFSLTDPLQQISYNEAASAETLGEVLWGGLEL